MSQNCIRQRNQACSALECRKRDARVEGRETYAKTDVGDDYASCGCCLGSLLVKAKDSAIADGDSARRPPDSNDGSRNSVRGPCVEVPHDSRAGRRLGGDRRRLKKQAYVADPEECR